MKRSSEQGTHGRNSSSCSPVCADCPHFSEWTRRATTTPRMDDVMDLEKAVRNYHATQVYIAVIVTIILLIRLAEVFH